MATVNTAINAARALASKGAKKVGVNYFQAGGVFKSGGNFLKSAFAKGGNIRETVGLAASGALVMRGITGAASGSYKTLRNTGLINPLLGGRRVHHGYGKRGIDSNNQQTDGLVQSLHRNRRQR